MGSSLNYDGQLGVTPSRAAEVSPHDTNELEFYSLGLYVGTSGDLKVTTINGNTVTFRNCPVGIVPVRAKRVWATGTTATDIVALY